MPETMVQKEETVFSWNLNSLHSKTDSTKVINRSQQQMLLLRTINR